MFALCQNLASIRAAFSHYAPRALFLRYPILPFAGHRTGKPRDLDEAGMQLGKKLTLKSKTKAAKGADKDLSKAGPSWALESCEWRVAVCVCRPHIGLQKGGSAVQTSERKHDPRSSTRYAASCCFCLLPVSSCKGDCPVSERLE